MWDGAGLRLRRVKGQMKEESDKPKMISKTKPEKKMLLILALFSALYCAEYFTIAELTPQSRNVAIRVGAIRAIEYNP